MLLRAVGGRRGFTEARAPGLACEMAVGQGEGATPLQVRVRSPCGGADARALRVVAAAAAAGAQCTVLEPPPAQQAQVAGAGAARAGGFEVTLGAPVDVTLRGGSAAACALLGAGAAAADALTTEALELDGARLLPAAAEAISWPQGGVARLEDALGELEALLERREGAFVAGAAPGAADWCLWASLAALLHAGEGGAADAWPAAVRVWAEAVSSTDAAKAALGDLDAGALAAGLREATGASSAPRLPRKGQRNVLITSALPYVNNVPHLGNIIGCVLSADVYARFCRARGYNAVYVCGTDEYGTATQTKAMEEGLSCRQICDKYHAIHRDIYEWFDIDFDHFGRTSTPTQSAICQDIYNACDAAGNCVEDVMQQLYHESVGFLADRLVEGTCPKCKYEDARGDQCDACGALLNPTDLIKPRCKANGATPEVRSTRHIFLDLPKVEARLGEYVATTSKEGNWTSNCLAVTKSWLANGLKQRCITRDLRWGTPVPREGYENKVFYVWFDAPIGYISITATYTPEWERWWKNPAENDVELVQFMGKDNVPFHTVIFPCTLLGTGQDWTMMKAISVCEYLNYEGGKFSKSRGVGVFGNDAKETGIPAEVWRYYLLINRPEQSDSMFVWDDLAAKNNTELLANLGNFVNRALSFMKARLGGVVPTVAADAPDGVALGDKVAPLLKEYVEHMEKIKLKDGLKAAMMVSKAGNVFLQETAPWVLFKSDKQRCEEVVASAAGLVLVLCALLAPFIPSFTRKVLGQLGLPEQDSGAAVDEGGPLSLRDGDFIARAIRPHLLLPAGHALGAPAPIFSQMSDEQVEGFRAQFAGGQAARVAAGAAGAAGGAAAKGKGKAAAGAKGKGKDGKPAPAPKKKGAAPARMDVSAVDIRVGTIVEVKKHPDADALYVEKIDVGEEEPRTIVSGLVKHKTEAQMLNARVLVLANIKTSKMRGIPSQGMVLCASSGETVDFVVPPEGVANGERVAFAGFEGEPDEVLNPKKKQWDAVQPELKTNTAGVAQYQGVDFGTSKGPCKSAVAEGSIR